MKASSDNLFNTYKDYDFSGAAPVAKTPHLAKLQAETGGKSRITMRVDNEVLAAFKARAEMVGGSYQTLMNDALKQFSYGLQLSDVVRDAIHETLEPYLASSSVQQEKKQITSD